MEHHDVDDAKERERGASSGKASGHCGAPPNGFPLLQSSDEAGVRLNTSALPFDEGVGVIEGHSVVTNEICDYDS